MVTVPDDQERVMRLIAVLDLQTGARARLLKLPEVQDFYCQVALRPDNQVLAAGWCDKVLLYDLYPSRSPLDPEVIFGDDWSLDGLGWARPMACYSLEDRKEVRGVWFSKEGIVLKVLSEKGDAVLMAVDEEQVIQKTPAPTDEPDKIWCSAITAQGRAAASIRDNKVLVWDVPGWGEA
jgi:hypothetical protein